jgi:hypothetical protein
MFRHGRPRAGAFGHPRLWEKLLGGVTRDLLDDMNFPEAGR